MLQHVVLTQIPTVLYVTFNFNRDVLSKHMTRNKYPGPNEPPFKCATPMAPSYCRVKWHASSVGSSQSFTFSINWELMKTNGGFCFTSLLEIGHT